MREIIELLGIQLFDSDEYCDVMEDCSQYTDVKWLLEDMKEYDGMTVALYFDGKLVIYNLENNIVFDGSLMDSSDFKQEMMQLVTR